MRVGAVTFKQATRNL